MKAALRRRSRVLPLVATGTAVLVLALGASWYLFLRDETTPISVADATKRFQRSREGALPATVNGVPVPRAGVYVYETSGFETLDLPIGSARHDYPSRTVISVARGGCGVQMRWEALAERSTTWDTCPARGRRPLRTFAEAREFFGNRVERLYRCEGGALAWATGQAGRRMAYICAAPETSSAASGGLVGTETVRVGGRAVKALRVRLRIRLAGVNRGGGISETWYAMPSGLIVRRKVSTDNLTATSVGDGHYRERYELRLDSLEPRVPSR